LEIDKGASRTDWLARPLSDNQLIYAAADVWYLLPLYQRMQEALAQTRWQEAAQQDCEALLLKREQHKDP
ncbi:ribonuclease D, partial [Pasteurella multocida subsp. multocida str. Anand1_cattle]